MPRVNKANLTSRATVPQGYQVCNRCEEMRPLSDYRVQRGRPRTICTPCERIARKADNANRKKCPSCNRWTSAGSYVDEFDNPHEKCRRCRPPRTGKKCGKCKQHKLYSEFHLHIGDNGKSYTQSHCRACNNSDRKYGVDHRWCRGCKRVRYPSAFGPRWEQGLKASVQHLDYVHYCLDCKPIIQKLDLKSVSYDYAFARSALDYTHGQACRWIAVGYQVDLENIERKMSEVDPNWEPDPVTA